LSPETPCRKIAKTLRTTSEGESSFAVVDGDDAVSVDVHRDGFHIALVSSNLAVTTAGTAATVSCAGEGWTLF
jgi:hypothetical protein